MHLGNFDLSDTVHLKFTTVGTTGAPTQLAGTPAVSVYKTNSVTQSTSGVTLTVDFDGVTGLNHVAIDTSSDGTFYASGCDFQVVITTGTVGGTSVVGYVVASFSIRNRAELCPTTADRTLDVSAGGEAGVDWANVGSPTTSLALTGTTIASTQKVDVDTIKTNPVVNGGTITFPTTATLASTTNITAGTITTATNVTTVNGLAAGVITAASIAADAITAAKVAADVSTEIRSLASGTSDSGSTTTMVDAARTEADTDYWKGMLIVFTSGNIAGQARVITAFDPATDTITFAPATTQAVSTQTYEIWPVGDFLRPTTSGRTLDVSTGGEAGLDWANVGSPTTVVGLSGTTVKTATDVETDTQDIQGRLPAALGANGNIKADVRDLLGTAWLTPGTAGTPDVNVKLWNGLTTVALPLVPTVAGRTLDVSAGGEAGVDWANVGTPGSTVNLSATTVNLVNTLTTYTGNTVQTGDSYAIVNSGVHGNAAIKGYVDDIGVAGAGLTAIPWNAAWDTEVQSEVEDALVLHRLDELLNADSDIDGAAPPTVGSVFHELMTKTAGSFTYDQTTDSLEAIRDRGDAAWTTATGFSTHTAADVWAVATRTLTSAANITSTGGTITVSSGSVPVYDFTTAAKALLQTEAEDALQTYHLDHLLAVAAAGTEAVNSSYWSRLVSKSATPAYSSFDNTTDSLEALRDRGDAAWITATGFSTHSAADVWAVATRVLTAGTNIVLAKGTGVTGFTDIDAAGVRTAVGLASANLDTQLDALPTAAENATAVLTTAMTEAYAADGATATLAQMQYMLWSALVQFTIVGTTITAYKLDGTTAAMTFTLDSTTPTLRTRAT